MWWHNQPQSHSSSLMMGGTKHKSLAPPHSCIYKLHESQFTSVHSHSLFCCSAQDLSDGRCGPTDSLRFSFLCQSFSFHHLRPVSRGCLAFPSPNSAQVNNQISITSCKIFKMNVICLKTKNKEHCLPVSLHSPTPAVLTPACSIWHLYRTWLPAFILSFEPASIPFHQMIWFQ